MNESQKEILKMLSEQKISVEEAERLLKAVAESEEKEKGSRFRFGGSKTITGALETMGEALAGIGPTVKGAVEDVFAGISSADWGEVEEEDLEEVELEKGKFAIPEGTELVVRNDRTEGPGGGDLHLASVTGDKCKVEGDEAENVRVHTMGSIFLIRWAGGPLSIEVPEAVSKLRGTTKGGDIKLSSLKCETEVKTLGGDLYLEDMSAPFKAKTMGGNIDMSLNPSWKGDSRATTMGGRIKTVVGENVDARIKATTMGGTIKVEKELGETETRHPLPGSSVVVSFGNEETRSELRIKTMGGDIKLLRKKGEKEGKKRTDKKEPDSDDR